MRYVTLVIIILLSLTIPLAAQDNDSTPYEIALERIAEAEATNATVLDLNSLGLTEVPPEIGSLSNLQVLDLSHNQLSSLPFEIGNMGNLRVLTLGTNQLSTLPSEIGSLSNLQWLHLDYNQLSGLPPEIGNLSNLCALYIQNNQLRHLPTQLGTLENLASPEICYFTPSGLYVAGNPLISPPPEVITEGTGAILAYLRHQAWWHLQRLVVSIASVVGGIVLFILGIRWRNRRHRKPKQKRG